MQNDSALYKILLYPFVYETFQKLISKNNSRQKFVDNFLKPFPGMKMIDIGCGPCPIILVAFFTIGIKYAIYHI